MITLVLFYLEFSCILLHFIKFHPFYRDLFIFEYTESCSENWIVLHVQTQHDYMLGNYPVGRDDAAQLAALQILADIGPLPNPEATTYVWNPNIVKVNHYL